MGQIRKSRAQINDELDKIYEMRLNGNSYDVIADKLGIKRRNFFAVYLPKLKKRVGQQIPMMFDQGEKDIQDKLFIDELERWKTICIGKCIDKSEKASADWMKTAMGIKVLLYRFRNEGFTALNLNEYRRLSERMGEVSERSEPNILQAGDSESAEPTEAV